jgi:glycosyltransferase involved in cell wall biosynthesis
MRTHLNICIPTFNRSDYLIEALNSFEKDTLEKYYNLINIYISDNASTDDTETAVSQYKSKTSLNIQYIKQKYNKGALVNLFEAVKMIEDKTGHFWLFGDDDKINKGSIERIFYEINENEIDILLMNRIICDINLNPIRNDSYFKDKKDVQFIIRNDEDYIKYLKSIKTLDGLMCFISSIIGGPNLLNFIIQELEQDNFYKQNLFPHTYFIHKYIRQNANVRIHYLSKPLIYWRGDNTSKDGRTMKINSMMNYEEQIQIAIKVIKNRNVLKEYLNVIKNTYHIGRHLYYTIGSDKDEIEYNRYIVFLLRFNIFFAYYLSLLEIVIVVYKYIKMSLLYFTGHPKKS